MEAYAEECGQISTAALSWVISL